MKRFSRSPLRLQGKLTLSYTLITIVTVILIELLTFSALLVYGLSNQVALLASSIQVQGRQAVPYFVHSAPDRKALAKWLQVANISIPTGGIDTLQGSFLAVVDSQGMVLAARGAAAPVLQMPLQNRLSAQGRTNLVAVLHGHSEEANLGAPERNGMLLLLAPIQDGHGPVLGALVVNIPALSGLDLFVNYGNLLRLIGINFVLLIVLAGGAGTLFGALTARGFTRRFKGLSQAADNWSRGDFSSFVHDPSGDELGQLARRLNRMAEDLQNLLTTRQQLATLEERNRLARDLHDSVKQQIFSLSMQVGALKVLLRRDTDAAERRLEEIARMVRLAQEELTALIHELRPVALTGKDLASALQDLARQWEQQTWISTQVHIEGVEALPTEVEEVLFRIVQEALSNVARHSNATAVQIHLCGEQEQVTLSLSDNGRGFDVAKATGHGVGLLSMRERIQALDGDIQIEGAVGKGTEIRVRCSVMHAQKKEVSR